MDYRDILNNQLMAAVNGGEVNAPVENSVPQAPSTYPSSSGSGLAQQKQQNTLNRTQEKQAAILGQAAVVPQYTPEDISAAQREVAVSRAKGIDTPQDNSLAATLRYGNTADFINQFGFEGAADVIGANANANAQALYESTVPRSNAEAVKDFGTSVVSGAVSGIGGLAALGSQVMGASDASRLISEVTTGATDWLGKTQSKAAQLRAGMENEAAKVREKNSNAQYELDRQQHGDVVASLMQLGRDASESIKSQLSDPALTTAGTGQAIGSILVSGGLGRAISVGAQKLAPNVLKSQADKLVAADMKKLGITAETAAIRHAANKKVLQDLEERITVPLGIGSIEAGGAYQQTYDEVIGMKHDELMRDSPDYRELFSKTKSEDKAKQELAQSAGLKVAGFMFPLAIAAGRLVSPFERAPFSPGSLKAAAVNVLAKEPIEEALQGGTSQALMNTVLKHGIDPDRSYIDGVGAEVGTGALYGSMAAGVMQGPGAAVKGAVGAATALGKGAKGAANLLTSRKEKVQQKNQKAATAAADAEFTSLAKEVNAELAPAMENIAADETISPEAKDKTSYLISRISQVLKTNTDNFDERVISPEVGEILTDSTNNVQALDKLMDIVSNTKNEFTSRFSAMYAVNTILENAKNYSEILNEDLSDIPNGEAIKGAITKMGRIAKIIEEHPATNEFHQMVVAHTEQLLKGKTEKQIEDSTPAEIQQMADAVEMNPTAATAEQVNTILRQNAANVISLDPAQQKILDGISKVLKTAEARVTANADNTEQSRVTEEILTKKLDPEERNSRDTPVLSAGDHIRGVIQAVRTDNLKLAQNRLDSFYKFVQSMNNKVDALNRSAATENGDKVFFETVSPDNDRVFATSGKPVFFNKKSPESIKLANTINKDAADATSIYESLVEAFKESFPNAPVVTKFSFNATPNKGMSQKRREHLTQVVSKMSDTDIDKNIAKYSGNDVTNAAEFTQILEAEKAKRTENKKQKKTDKEPVNKSPDKPKAKPLTKGLKSLAEALNEIAQTLGIPGVTVRREDDPARIGWLPKSSSLALPGSRASKASITEALNHFGKHVLYGAMAKELGTNISELINQNGNDLSEVFKEHRPDIYAAFVSANTSDSFNTWASKQLSQAIQRNTATMGIVEKFFAKIANALQKAFNKINGNQLFEEIGVKEFDAWVAELIDKDPKVNPEASTEETLLTVPATKAEKLSSWFPQLIGVTVKAGQGIYNWFTRGYLLNKENNRPAYFGKDAIEWFHNTITNPEALNTALKGKTPKTVSHELVEGYKLIPWAADTLAQKLRDSLKSIQKTKPSLFASHNESKQGHLYKNGKLLNIMEKDESGEHIYNEYLLRAASLAAMQWFISFNQREDSAMPVEAIAKILGKPEAELTAEEINRYQAGPPAYEIVNSLARKIEQYWGVKANSDIPMGLSSDIAKALAAELLINLVDIGAVTENLHKAKDANGKTKTIQNFSPNVDESNPFIQLVAKDDSFVLSGFTDLVDILVTGSSEKAYFLAEENIPVNNHQLRNQKAKITEEQKKVIEKAQSIEYRPVTTMVGALYALGKGAAKLFGQAPVDEKAEVLDEYRLANDSRSRGFSGAMSVLADMLGSASLSGKKVQDAAFRYGFDFTSVNRLQMRGRYNPQANKLMREMLSPSQSTLDLSNWNTQDSQLFGTALANALGVKVYKNTLNENSKQARELLDGKLKPAVEVLSSWLKAGYNEKDPQKSNSITPENQEKIAKAFENAGVELTEVAFHAALTYASFLNTPSNSKNKFSTQFYMEIDGITNGPANSRQIFKNENYTEEDLLLDRISGLFIGRNTTMDQIREKGNITNTDLYELGAKNLRSKLDVNINGNAPGLEQSIVALAKLLNSVGEDIVYEKDHSFTVGRGFMKNPMTVILYGAGENGLGNKFTNIFVSGFYKKVSELTNPKDRQKYIDETIALLDQIIPEHNLRDIYKNGKFNTEFKFDSLTTSSLSEQFKESIVEPIIDSTWYVIGDDIRETVTRLQTATNIQSMFVANKFKKAVDERLNQKAKTPEGKLQFLSPKELDEILTDLEKYSPSIKTQFQNFFLKNGESRFTELDTVSSMNGRFASGPEVFQPELAGVSAIPYLNIGSGDGLMIQGLYEMYKTGNFLPVFDGVNFTISDLIGASESINEAVYRTWTNNPLTAVVDSYGLFFSRIKQSDITEIISSESEYQKAFLRAINDLYPRDMYGHLSLMQKLNELYWETHDIALAITARQEAMKRMPVWVHQMAGVPQAYSNGVMDSLDMQSMSDKQLVDAVNEIIGNTKTEIEGEWSAAREKAIVDGKLTVPSNPIAGSGNTVKNGVTTVPANNLEASLKTTIDGITDGTTKGLAKFATKIASLVGYTLHFGTLEDLNKAFPNIKMEANTPGSIDIDERVIFLVQSPRGGLNTTTVIHELIHAITASAIKASVAGTLDRDFAHLNATEKKAINDTVGQLARLLDLFLNQDDAKINELGTSNFQAFRDEILDIRQQAKDGKISNTEALVNSLSEFMAWGLSEHSLIETAKNTKAYSGSKWMPKWLNKVRNKILTFFQLLGLKKDYLSPGDNVYTQLNFAAHLFGSLSSDSSKPPPRGPGGKKTLLFQRNRPASATGNERLNRVTATFQRVLDNYSTKTMQGMPKTSQIAQKAARKADVSRGWMQGIDAAMDVQQFFALDPEEQAAFRLVVAALATQAEVDAASMTRAQELYEHAMEHISTDTFLADPKTATPQDIAEAHSKYEVLLGTSPLAKKNAHGRGNALPVFLALAMTSKDIRKVLSEIKPPKATKNEGKGFDTLVENIGYLGMDLLSSSMTDNSRKSNSIREAIDNLVEKIRQNQIREDVQEDSIEQAISNRLDDLNDWVAYQVRDIGSAAGDHGRNVSLANSKLKKSYGLFMQAVAGILNENEGELIATGVVQELNKHKVPHFLKDFLVDIIGRTDNNANIYDRIKKVRSAISALRQQYKETVPGLIKKLFSNTVSDSEWNSMFYALGKTDVTSLLDGMNVDTVLKSFTDPSILDSRISALESNIQLLTTKYRDIFKKSKQLATHMNTGVAGNMLFRNALSIEKNISNTGDAKLIKHIDQLTSLYALKSLDHSHRDAIARLYKDDPEAMRTVFNYLREQRNEENRKAGINPLAAMNQYKGFVPAESKRGQSLVVASDREMASLLSKSYRRIGTYQGSDADHTKGSMGYYLAPVSQQAMFNQGIVQVVRNTVSGVDANTGYSYGIPLAGRITGEKTINNILNNINNDNGVENLIPVFDIDGKIIAFERTLDPQMIQLMEPKTNFADVLGTWRGRQAEEVLANVENDISLDTLKRAWDTANTESKKRDFVDISKPEKLDQVTRDAIALIPKNVMEDAMERFEGKFMVPKEMLKDVVGYRSASVGDAWSGNTRWSDKTMDTARDIAISLFGNKAYQYFVNGEKIIQNIVGNAKTIIVIKSIIVPVGNIISNVMQLVARGVPRRDILREGPRMLKEVDYYTKTRKKQIELEMHLRASVDNPQKAEKLKNQIQNIQDSHQRLSIWPLIAAGEFSAISDLSMTNEDVDLFEGKLHTYLENITQKMPSEVMGIGKQLIISKDTALYRGLEKATQYGDFIAKALFYHHLVNNKGIDPAKAMGKVTEEFINYDRLPGRDRGYLESVGLGWFFNYKIRITKVALGILRDNPLHALLASLVPIPDGLTAGSPLDDNLLTKGMQGSLGYSIGPGMLTRAPLLNPYLAALH